MTDYQHWMFTVWNTTCFQKKKKKKIQQQPKAHNLSHITQTAREKSITSLIYNTPQIIKKMFLCCFIILSVAMIVSVMKTSGF